MIRKYSQWTWVVGLLIAAGSASAGSITVGQDTYANSSAFDNEIIAASDGVITDAHLRYGTFSDLNVIFDLNRTQLLAYIPDTYPEPWGIQIGMGQPDYSVTIHFIQVSVFNGPGNDLAIYESGGPGSPETFGVMINGKSGSVTTDQYYFGSVCTGYVDLSDFGIAPGDSVDTITLTGSNLSTDTDNPDLIAVGANPVPLPAAVWTGLTLLGASAFTRIIRRRRA